MYMILFKEGDLIIMNIQTFINIPFNWIIKIILKNLKMKKRKRINKKI